jgi:hypothetical protein
MRKPILLVLIACLLFITAAGQAQTNRAAAFDTSRMQRDLEIMEAILDRLFDRSMPSFHFSGDGSRGVYMPGYGVLFQVPNNSFAFEIITMPPESEGVNVSEARAPKAARSKVSARQRIDGADVRKNLQNFFANYADAIGQIENDEYIAVYVHGNSNFIFTSPGISGATTATTAREIFAAARKADIVARRSGTLAEGNFNQRMQYRELPGGDEDSDLEVMARIVDTALRGKNQRFVELDAQTRPIYLEGLGALFLMRTSLGDHSSWFLRTPTPDTNELLDIERKVIELQAASKRARGTWKTKYHNLRTRLAEIMADYGHTLRRLQDDEWIIVAADLRDAPEESPRELVCRVQKNAIDAYNSRSISREQLLKKIDYLEF